MTRFFKVSLSVIALLLVTLVLFTGCANKALTAAEEAKQAVEDATADLEAAIEKKADADELTDKVEELTVAVEAAKALLTDGDIELKTAIEEAKKTLGDNAQTLISTLDVKIAGLLAEKADKDTVKERLDALDTLVQNINKVTNGAISIEKFTELSTTCAYYAYRLEVLWEKNIENYEDLYDDPADFVKLAKAYKTAEVAIYRATSMSVIEQAYANFEKTVKETPNAVDTLYYDSILPFVNNASDKTTQQAYDLYAEVLELYENSSDPAQNAIRKYYAGFFSLDTAKDATTENLLEKTLKIFETKLAADVTELGNRYLVHTGAGDYTDADDMANARTHINNYETAYAYVVGRGDVSESFAKYDVPESFTKNEARMAVLDNDAFNGKADIHGANAAVEYIERETLPFFGVEALAEVTDELIAAKSAPEKNSEDTPITTPDVVNTINTLNDEIIAWYEAYVSQPMGGQTQDNQERYEANKAPIEEVAAVVERLYNYLYDTVVAEYKKEAQEFIDLVYVPDNIEAGIFDADGNYYFATNVKSSHGEVIDAANELADAWETKWIYVDLDVYANTAVVTAEKAFNAIKDAKSKLGN